MNRSPRKLANSAQIMANNNIKLKQKKKTKASRTLLLLMKTKLINLKQQLPDIMQNGAEKRAAGAHGVCVIPIAPTAAVAT